MSNIKNIILWVLCIVVASFFIYKGLNKHWIKPCKIYPADTTLPAPYVDTITALCNSGFLKLIGTMQILGGLLLLIPRVRIVGIFLLLAIIFNIFMLHLFLDNRPEELVETGIPMLAILVLAVLTLQEWRRALEKPIAQ